MKRSARSLWIGLTFAGVFLTLGVARGDDFVLTPYEVLGKPLSLDKIAKPEGHPLTLVGFGIRKKKVVLVNVSVYVAGLYVGQPKDWNPSDTAASFKKQTKRFLSLTFLRDVPGEKMKNAFADSLESNRLDPKREDIAKALNALTTDMKEGNRMTLLGITEPGKPQKLIATGSKAPIEVTGNTLVDDLFSIWFGKPADGNMEDLQAQLKTRLK